MVLISFIFIIGIVVQTAGIFKGINKKEGLILFLSGTIIEIIVSLIIWL
jgi:hypothetical protein